jgi:hypothetical protein
VFRIVNSALSYGTPITRPSINNRDPAKKCGSTVSDVKPIYTIFEYVIASGSAIIIFDSSYGKNTIFPDGRRVPLPRQ